MLQTVKAKSISPMALLRCGLCGAPAPETIPVRTKMVPATAITNAIGTIKGASSGYQGKTRCTMPPMPASKMIGFISPWAFLPARLVWDEQYMDKVNPSIEPELERARQRVENIQNALKTNKIMIANNDRTQGLEKFLTLSNTIPGTANSLKKESISSVNWSRLHVSTPGTSSFSQARKHSSRSGKTRVYLKNCGLN